MKLNNSYLYRNIFLFHTIFLSIFNIIFFTIFIVSKNFYLKNITIFIDMYNKLMNKAKKKRLDKI